MEVLRCSVVSSDARFCRSSLSIPFLLCVAIAPAFADVNSWTKPTSGYWEEQSYWSLEMVPDATQSVMFTNAGWKALVIGTNAAQKFPQSMQIQGLQVSSPLNSYNTLLIDFTGFELPLQTTSLSIGTNSAVVVQGSVLDVTNTGTTGDLYLGGTFSQGDYSLVKVHGGIGLRIGNPSSGAYYLTNGTLSVNSTLWVGDHAPGQFVQYGGSNNIGSMMFEGFWGGRYDLYDGQITATNGITVGSGDYADGASFYQYGGSVNADTLINGYYTLNGGTMTGRLTMAYDPEVGGQQRVDAYFVQNGGTNYAPSMDLGHPNQFGGGAHYTLSNGVVHVDFSTTFGAGWFYQYNGQHTIVSNLVMSGQDVGVGTIYAQYFLSGGTLSVGGLSLQPAHFLQSGGSNLIAGDLVLGATPRNQSTYYSLAGGTVAVKNISIGDNAFFQHTGGNIIQTGVLTLNHGTWFAATGDYTLGLLQLGGPTNSTIVFPGGSSILRLANSSGQPWPSGAILYVTNWHGSTSGGGATQLYFGSNASGLTAQQLARVQFQISGGTYPATILSTGEVVPASVPPSLVNSWINPGSGAWEDSPSWSLGVTPNQSQSVMITNAGSKAVAIGTNTSQKFPQSMTVTNLTVSGPTNTENTLLLNYFGTAVPLTVLNEFDLGTNGRLELLSSRLQVDNLFNVNGTFNQENGELDFTNSPASIMQIEGGHFNLTNGLVTGANLYLGGANDGFVYQDGLVSVNWLVLGDKPSAPGLNGNGTYVLQRGWLIAGIQLIGDHGFGTLTQSGGTNSGSIVSVGPGLYLKNGGGLFAGEVEVATSGGSLTHAGGTATITNVLRLDAGSAAMFNMFGGSLSTPRIEMVSGGLFTQSNGTVNVANELFMEGNNSSASGNAYYLDGGNLFTARTTVSFTFHSSTAFIQNGGTHMVTNTLWINGSSTLYQFHGGTLNAPNIVLTGGISQPPQFIVLGAPSYSITNQNISLTGGALVIQDSAQRFGCLTIDVDAAITLGGNAAILRFADSHTNNWQGGLSWRDPTLVVYNWNGSTNGGGTDQLSFGNNSSALTASQLAQIQFVNPAGFAAGNYPAKILSTGEVVPTSAPTLGFQKDGANLVLNWPGSFILQNATNVAGPYVDVTNATSPYGFDTSQSPKGFFRLRNSP